MFLIEVKSKMLLYDLLNQFDFLYIYIKLKELIAK